MDRLIRHIRVIPNISGSVRKPVAVYIFLAGKPLDPGNDLTVDHIVHISGNTHCPAGKNAEYIRKGGSFSSQQLFPSASRDI